MGKSLVKHIYLIDHNFEERRKISKGKPREGSIINIKLIWYAPLIRICKGPDILLELVHVRKNREF